LSGGWFIGFEEVGLPREVSTRRDQAIAVAEGLGIVLVVAGHVTRGLVASGIASPDGSFLNFDTAVYSFHMPLFMLLSGLFIAGSVLSRGAKVFTINRVLDLLYVYVLWSLFQGAIVVSVNRWTNRRVTVRDVLTPWIPQALFWFLPCLALMTVVVVVLHP
jgi:fucose 4-O-acetylase-like acetyltransferase